MKTILLNIMTMILAGVLIFSACTPAPIPTTPDANATVLVMRQSAADQTEAAIRTIQAATANAPTHTPTMTPTSTPSPTPTATPTQTLSPTPDFTGQYSKAHILVFDVLPAANYTLRLNYESYIKTALDAGGYTYTYLLDKPGAFLTALKEREWDLIIIGAESRDAVFRDTYPFLWQHVARGGALIWEIWVLPDLTTEWVRTDQYTYDLFWDHCGVTSQENYTDDMSRQIFLPDPAARILQVPAQIEQIGQATPVWKGDIGELLKITQPGKVQILAQISERVEKDIVLVSCYEGRMILQSFGSHDYPKDVMVALWGNYIVNTLDAMYRKQAAPADPFTTIKADASILIIDFSDKSSMVLNHLGYRDVTWVRSTTSMARELEEKTWDVILITIDLNKAADLAVLPRLQEQVDNGTAVWVNFGSLGLVNMSESTVGMTVPEEIESMLAGCGLSFTDFVKLGTFQPKWWFPDHPLASQPLANREISLHWPSWTQGRLFQKTTDSQTVFPVSLSGGEADGRGLLAVCPGNRLVFQAAPLGSDTIFMENLLEFFLRP